MYRTYSICIPFQIIYNTQKSAAGIYVCIVHELRTQNEMFAAELFVLGESDKKFNFFNTKMINVTCFCFHISN